MAHGYAARSITLRVQGYNRAGRNEAAEADSGHLISAAQGAHQALEADKIADHRVGIGRTLELLGGVALQVHRPIVEAPLRPL